MAETDVDLAEDIAEECELTEQERSLLFEVIAGVYTKEAKGWSETIKKLEQALSVQIATRLYFKINPLPSADIERH